MQTLKSFFSKKSTEKNPQIEQTFDHSKISASDDISQCPFMKNKQNKMTNQQEKCPYKGQKKQKTKKTKETDQSSSSDQQQVPRGGCPFMGGSQKKRNPDLILLNSGFDQPFVSKFSYYLSSNKIDFTMLKSSTITRPISKSREIFNQYPIYLKHTLFYNGQDYQKVRNLQCCSRFMPYEKLRQKGNKYFNKGKYQLALDYYQRALSLFKWLQYYQQQDNKSKTDQISFIQSNQSIDSQSNLSQTQQNNSKIQLNLSTQSQQQITQKDDKLQQMTTKYKQFFVIYNDNNTKLYDGQQMQQQPDIDMRRSLMLQLLINMASAYLKLNHYHVAMQCIQDCLNLSDKVSQVYLRKAQVLISNKGCTLGDAVQARKCMEKAIQMKKSQKIFQSNQNILKMVNLHKADEAYNYTLSLINQKITQKQLQVDEITQKLYTRAKQIHENEQRIIREGKVPFERDQQSMLNSKQFKILLRMKQKYIKVLQFYSQAKNQQQVILAKRQLQQLLNVFAQMNVVLNVKLQEKDNQLGGLQTQKIQKRLQSIKKSYCEDIYNAAKFNFTVMEWAIKEIIKEQRRQEELKKKAQQEQRKRNGEQVFTEKQGKYDFLKKASWGLVLIPIAGVILNNFLLA